MNVKEMIEWLKTQDQEAEIEVLSAVVENDQYFLNWEMFNPEKHSYYDDLRNNVYVKDTFGENLRNNVYVKDILGENLRTLYLGDTKYF